MATVGPIIEIHIEKLPEGQYLATTDDSQGLVAQGNTIADTLEIDRNIARILIEEQNFYRAPNPLPAAVDIPDYPIIMEA